ncbi:NAD(P)/FAD-dependent oxidoreductase [Caldinitratiruptor microaerophilus]|uniref:Ferredoxin--NADP reductase n=1 Tax=Caldinitratiruptor microaerophilus TaxID=671077 RepID=A0AA35CM83_9FIRM|nr:NAD(P)/FAD-dependent oxidoreductase [Caldinitratiruptor microaerophilus]BDG60958.1 ferredoxin--NADP reductase [Caldinitratiruptor microaerophilus]
MSEHSADLYDITFIGGGPTGLFGIFYAGMRHARTKVIESLPELGGQLTALYPEKYIYDVGGFPEVLARDLVENLKKQAFTANPDCTVCLGERVIGLTREADGTFTLTTDKGTHRSRAVIITAGIGGFEPNRLPNEDAQRFEGKGVWYNIPELAWFQGKQVLVIGGGDSAVDYALMLEPIARHVTLIHRRDGFRAHDASVKKLAESSVEVKLFYELKSLSGDGWVREATIFDNRTKEETTIPVDAVVIGTGFKASLGAIKDWGLEMKGNQIVVNSKGETNIPGVYAAGDIAWYPGKIRLIATGFGEVATAVNNAKAFIDPGSAVFPGHSSEKSEEKKELSEKK